MAKTVYISIGNSDDKLSQREWAAFYRDTNRAVRYCGRDQGEPIIHGQWVSEPASAWQNACWCVELTPALEERLRRMLALIADAYRQDSIAWAEAATEFIGPPTTQQDRDSATLSAAGCEPV